MVAAALKENGLSALPSQTNFMFVDLGTGDAEKFREAMASRNVLIRGIYRDYTNWSRVSMGKIEDVKMYADALPYAIEAIS
jgi:histidinol-phosphate aminotransferase